MCSHYWYHILINQDEIVCAGLMAGKNENDSTETSAILQRLNKICDTCNMTILLIHHLSKAACVPEVSKDGLEMHHVRGSSAIAAFVRNIVGMFHPSKFHAACLVN